MFQERNTEPLQYVVRQGPEHAVWLLISGSTEIVERREKTKSASDNCSNSYKCFSLEKTKRRRVQKKSIRIDQLSKQLKESLVTEE